MDQEIRNDRARGMMETDSHHEFFIPEIQYLLTQQLSHMALVNAHRVI